MAEAWRLTARFPLGGRFELWESGARSPGNGMGNGNVIDLAAHRAARAGRSAGAATRAPVPVSFYFDLACPFSYLAAERAERLLPGARWQPVLADALHAADPWSDPGLAALAAARAVELRLALVWPARRPRQALQAMRAAAYACEQGRGPAFATAALRLAFCGGFDLSDPEVLAEAAGSSAVDLDGCLRAAADTGRDGALEATGRRLLAHGADRMPVVALGEVLYSGESGIDGAALALRAAAAAATPAAR